MADTFSILSVVEFADAEDGYSIMVVAHDLTHEAANLALEHMAPTVTHAVDGTDDGRPVKRRFLHVCCTDRLREEMPGLFKGGVDDGQKAL